MAEEDYEDSENKKTLHGKRNLVGETKIAILNSLTVPLNEYEIRESLIRQFSDPTKKAFTHKTELNQIRRLHLDPLIEKGWIKRVYEPIGDGNITEPKYVQTGKPRHFTLKDVPLLFIEKYRFMTEDGYDLYFKTSQEGKPSIPEDENKITVGNFTFIRNNQIRINQIIDYGQFDDPKVLEVLPKVMEVLYSKETSEIKALNDAFENSVIELLRQYRIDRQNILSRYTAIEEYNNYKNERLRIEKGRRQPTLVELFERWYNENRNHK